MYRNILVPVDGSTTSERGLDEAIKLARLTGARLRLLHVVDDLPFMMNAEGYGAMSSDVLQLSRNPGRRSSRRHAPRSSTPVESSHSSGVSRRSSGRHVHAAGPVRRGAGRERRMTCHRAVSAAARVALPRPIGAGTALTMRVKSAR